MCSPVEISHRESGIKSCKSFLMRIDNKNIIDHYRLIFSDILEEK